MLIYFHIHTIFIIHFKLLPQQNIKFLMSDGQICERVQGFNFYNLEQYEFVANVERSKSFVYLYRHLYSKQLIAVKECKLQNLSSKQIEYKKKIIKMIQELNHPNIVQYKGLVKLIKKSGDKYYESMLIFMEYCQKNLYECINQHALKKQPFTVQQIRQFLCQIIDPLAKLEKWGVAHRDIKPQNILKKENTYKLCDFQDALYCEGNFIEGGINITTVEYSPLSLFNQLKYKKKKAYDPFKVDVYSLGLTTLVICSLGKFNPSQRINYADDHRSHKHYMKQIRKKYVKQRYQSQFLNRVVKLMMEEDQYKRESFITLRIKIQKLSNRSPFDESKSQNSSNSQSSTASKKEQIISRKPILNKVDLKKIFLVVIGIINLLIFLLLCIY